MDYSSSSPLSLNPEQPPTAEEMDSLERSTYKPNSGDVNMQDVMAQEAPKSFKDKLVNGGFSSMDSLVSYEEICAANPSPIFTIMEDPVFGVKVRVPEVFIPKEIHNKICTPWRNSMIIKLLDKSINFFTLRARLLREWKTEKAFDIIDIGLGYYIIRFHTNEECQHVLTNGPYKFFDHYLAVQPWEPNFQPTKAKMPKTAVWVHLESTSMEQFTGPMLRYLVQTLGKPIKIDYNTMLASRGRFARVCVKIDLSQTLPPMIKLRLEEYSEPTIVRCAYEGLHTICFSCGEYGHHRNHAG